MGVVSKGDMRYLFGVVVLEYLCSGGEGLFRGAEREFDGDYFHFGEIDAAGVDARGRAGLEAAQRKSERAQLLRERQARVHPIGAA